MTGASTPVGQIAAAFREAGLRFRLGEPLRRYTTIGIGGPAEVMVFPAAIEEMLATFRLARRLGLPVRVLGSGSNLLVADQGVEGLVIHAGAMKILRFGEGGKVEAEAGVQFPGLVRTAVSRGLRGLEGGVGIPGSLGGVLAMNAGAFDFSVGDWVERVTVVSPRGERLELDRSQVDFRYRSTSLGEGVAIASCLLNLREDRPEAIQADLERHMNLRKSSQPVGVKSAGCIFKNPPGESAGKIIDQLTLKGFGVGGARVSEVHANFIVHDGGARAADVFALIEAIKEKVLRATGVELEEEVKRWS